MPNDGYATFGGVPNFGARMTHVRGIRPSVCQILVEPQATFASQVGTLTFTYDDKSAGVQSFSFPNSAVREISLRHPSVVNQAAHRWVVNIEDRRWKWRYPTVSGCYNIRDTAGTLQSEGTQSAQALADILFSALGEVFADTSQVPTTVFPFVDWDCNRAALELEWLLDQLGMTVVLDVSTNIPVCVQLLDGGGANPTASGGILAPPMDHSWKAATLPKEVQVVGGPTVTQTELDLIPVGLETNGSILAIDDLSYLPAEGWGWPGDFRNIASDVNRRLALHSVFRWYRINGGWDGDGVTINSYRQVELRDHLAETNYPFKHQPLKAVVKGDYWPYTENSLNVSGELYQGNFEIDSQLGLVKFEKPVFLMREDQEPESQTTYYEEVAPPTNFKLVTSYTVKTPDLSGWSRVSSTAAVSLNDTEPRVVCHPELARVRNLAPVYAAAPHDNLALVTTEAGNYASLIAGTYGYVDSRDYFFSGLQAASTSGPITQVEWACGEFGRNGVPYTRIGVNTEPDIKTPGHWQRRRDHKVEWLEDNIR